MTSTSSRLLATDLRRNAESISKTFAQCERTCLDIGSRLGEAIPGLSDLATLFKSLSQSLEGEALYSASEALDAIARELAEAADSLTEESRDLTSLVGMNRAVAQQITNLIGSVRTVNALVFNVKIESASLSRSGDDMVVLADELQQLARRAQSVLDDYERTHRQLYELLCSSSDAQTAFQRSHQAGLRLIATEIRESLGAVAERRREIGTGLQDISAQSLKIGEEIGQCVVALQIGDSTRQRVEHVRSALDLSADSLEGVVPKPLAERADLGGEFDCDVLAARICRLQALQLDGAMDEFAREMDTIFAALQGVNAASGVLADRGQSLFGPSGSEDGSFLEALKHKLDAARAIVEQCQRSRAVVDRATIAVSTTMADLQKRTSSLSQIVVDVTMIGTNAVLKSSRLDEQGRGLNVIAQALRNHGSSIVEGIKTLTKALNEVVAFVARFSKSGRAVDSDQLAALDRRMVGAIVAFDANGKEMTAALQRLGGEGDAVRDLLGRAIAALGVHEEIVVTLREASSAVDTLSSRLGDAERESPNEDALIDAMLRPAYTMASERRIHEGLIGTHSQPAQNEPASDLPDAEELAEACLF